MIRPSSLREFHWLVAPEMPPRPSFESGGDAVHPVLRQVLYNRGISQPADLQSFLSNHYLQSRDPFKLADMDRAVDRIARALRDGEMIVVYGDFDADGVTATVLLTEALRDLADDRRLIVPYIPDRVDEGYGLNLPAPVLDASMPLDDAVPALGWQLLGNSQRLAEQYRFNGHWKLLNDWLAQLIELRALLGSLGQAAPRASSFSRGRSSAGQSVIAMMGRAPRTHAACSIQLALNAEYK